MRLGWVRLALQETQGTNCLGGQLLGTSCQRASCQGTNWGCSKIVPPKPHNIFPETPFGGISQVGSVHGESSSGQKIIFFLSRTPWQGTMLTFLCQQVPGRNYNDIFLTMARNLYILVRICTFWWEFVHFSENLYILARQDWPDEEKWSNSSPVCPGEENFWIFSRQQCPCKTYNFWIKDIIRVTFRNWKFQLRTFCFLLR